jgi:hypothetical protein
MVLLLRALLRGEAVQAVQPGASSPCRRHPLGLGLGGPWQRLYLHAARVDTAAPRLHSEKVAIADSIFPLVGPTLVAKELQMTPAVRLFLLAAGESVVREKDS